MSAEATTPVSTRVVTTLRLGWCMAKVYHGPLRAHPPKVDR
jgi:hypothetical protein